MYYQPLTQSQASNWQLFLLFMHPFVTYIEIFFALYIIIFIIFEFNLDILIWAYIRYGVYKLTSVKTHIPKRSLRFKTTIIRPMRDRVHE